MNDIPDSDLEKLAKDLDKKAKEVERAAKADNAMKMVSFNDLFTTSFLTANTQFSNFQDLLAKGKFEVNSLQDFMAIQGPKFDAFINKTTKFPTWEKMQSAAVAEYMERQNKK